MSKIERFEDLVCWQKARELVNKVYAISKKGPLSRDFGLKDQMQRAATSSMSNIAEGFTRYHKKEFIRFLDIAQRSAAEVKNLLYAISDQDYVSHSEVTVIQELAEEIRAVTLGLLRHVKQTLDQGSNRISEPLTQYSQGTAQLSR